jgi:hypothetical protein
MSVVLVLLPSYVSLTPTIYDEDKDNDDEFIKLYGLDGESLATIREIADEGDENDEDLHLD